MKITVELDAYEFATVVDILVNKNYEDIDDDDDTDDTPDEKSDVKHDDTNDTQLKFISALANAFADKIAKSSRACWQSLNLNHYGSENNEIQKTI